LFIFGSNVSDRLIGGGGNDTLLGLGGNDTLIGGAGNDVFVFSPSTNPTNERDLIEDFLVGQDKIDLSAFNTGAPFTFLGNGPWTGKGNEMRYSFTGGKTVLELDPGNGGADVFIEFTGSIALTVGSFIGAVAPPAPTMPAAPTAPPSLTGNASANKITGDAGNNLLSGLAGNDTLDGGAGNDTLNGGTGADVMSGGTGNDLYYIDAVGDRIQELSDQGDDHVITSVSWTLGAELERLTLNGSGNINATGNSLANALTGNAGANILDGAAGADILLGAAGNDTLVGGDGNDTLDGGAGTDILNGGNGADTYVFRPSSGGESETALGAARDTIASFAIGQDRIDLSAFDGATDLVFIGTNAFGGGAGPQLRYEIAGNTTVLQLDLTTGKGAPDSRADAEIALSGAFALTLADFVGVVAPVPASGAPVGAIKIAIGANAQQIVNAAPEGATFWFEAGVHRLVSINPKDRQTFLGDDAAVISGSKILTGFVQDGNAWSIGGQTQQAELRAVGEMRANFDHAGYPNVVFMDDKPLTAVDTRSEVGAGKYFFDYGADKIYLGTNPAGHLLEAAVSTYAFAGAATNVTISGLTIEKYATPIQNGTIGYNIPPVGWTIEQNEVRLNFSVGILGGTDTKIIDNHVHNNGQMGLGGNGNNILVQGNKIASNGFWSGIDILWEGGGTKFAETDGLIVRGNFSHDNYGYGLWTDIDNTGTLYEDNRVERNSHGGIVHEISYDAVIRNNTFVGNGVDFPQWLWGAAIQIQNSSDVVIYGNTIDMTAGGNGISLIQQDRGSGAYGEYLTTRNFVHDNVIIAGNPEQGASGSIADAFEADMLNGGNRFDRNEYHVSSTLDDHWSWGEFYDWDTYRAVSGQDANSQIVLM